MMRAGPRLIEVVRPQGNQKRELVLADKRVMKAEFLVAGKKRMAVTCLGIRGRYQSAARQRSVIRMSRLVRQIVDLRWSHGKGIDLKF